MMHSTRYPEASRDLDDSYRATHPQARNGRTYDERYAMNDRRHRNTPSPQRYTPPHDRSRTPPRGPSSGRGHGNAREWDIRRERDNSGQYANDTRGRSPASRSRTAQGYRDRDREGYQSPGYDSRSGSRSPRRERSPYYGGPPSREVMMDGLPVDLIEDDISKELKQFHGVEELDDVRIIRDRQTKNSRGFGFLRFPTVEKSKAFLERNYPIIHIYGKGSADGDEQAAKVRVAFSRERDDKSRVERPEGEWTCKICTFVNFPGRKICFKCQSPQIDMATFGNTAAKPSEFLNSGDSDASPDGTPSQFLLLRGLEPTVTEDLLAKGVSKLYKPSGGTIPSGVLSKKGNAKIASTTGDANLGAKEGSIRRVLLVRDRRSNESWRYGFAEFASVDDAQAALTRFSSFEKFTISSRPVTVCYIHAGVFVPVLKLQENKRFVFHPLGNTATRLAYWDNDAYASELVVTEAPDETTLRSAEARVKSSVDKAAAAAEKEGLMAPGKDTEAKAKKRKAETKEASKPKKTAPAHLQFWSNRHAELHGVKPEVVSEADGEDGKDNDRASSTKKTLPESKSTPARSFADLSKKCCYLCSRQFKTEAEVDKHERLSQLHRDNMGSEELKSKALAKMAKAGIPLSAAEEDTPEYRDRAKERRAAFGASKKISLPMKKAVDAKEAEEDEPPAAPSKGASLLGKMGWSSGEGLGAHGSGMTAPIATEMYVQGVGLGAEGGKMGDAVEEAGRNTKNDYGDFLERTKDKAKERFERLG